MMPAGGPLPSAAAAAGGPGPPAGHETVAALLGTVT